MEKKQKKNSELIEELEKAAGKRKKKSWKKAAVFLLLLVCLAAAGGLWWRNAQAERQSQVKVEAGEGQELKYVTVNSIAGNEVSGVLTEALEEKTDFQIPVGTPVITALGMETTFSRISAGNNIVLLLEKGTENILKIWIVQ